VTDQSETLSQLKKDFEWFRSECIKLQNTFNTYQAFFEGGDKTDQLLRESAGLFFHDLNDWLIQLIYLQMGRLTDRKESCGKKNLTVKHIIEALESVGRLNNEINKIAESIEDFRKKIIPARNRVFAHLDLDTFRDSITHGELEKNSTNEFFVNLQKFTDEVGIALGIGPLDYSVQVGSGDVIDLLRLLKKCKEK